MGTIFSILIVEYIDIKTAIYIFLICEFFTMMLSYGLPNTIGTFILESPSHIPENKEKENELIEVSNIIFIKEKGKNDFTKRSNSLNL